jgi:hypothetical protein
VVELTTQTTFLHGPLRANSQKPTEFYDFVESLCPAPRYADLFSRYRHNDKWDCHGDEAPAAAEPPPRVINIRAVGKWPAPNCVYVGRTPRWGDTKWGNYQPKIRSNATPAEHAAAGAAYRAWIVTQPDRMAELHELRGKDLACHCAPLPCHADVLLELANREAPREEAAE